MYQEVRVDFDCSIYLFTNIIVKIDMATNTVWHSRIVNLMGNQKATCTLHNYTNHVVEITMLSYCIIFITISSLFIRVR